MQCQAVEMDGWCAAVLCIDHTHAQRQRSEGQSVNSIESLDKRSKQRQDRYKVKGGRLRRGRK